MACQQLALIPFPATPSTIPLYHRLFKAQGSQLRKLRVRQPLTLNSGRLVDIISPTLKNLTHLELTSDWGRVGEASVFDIIFTYGHYLESLRIHSCTDSVQQHSTHFRRNARALPYIQDFAVHFSQRFLGFLDRDFFPSICAFLEDRPLLHSLELVATSLQILVS